ncbi:MAG: type II toxin-antitoxin system HicB family antitoxin [Verrucomicrobia bacterium]|nr:type II toxin-antitoxin system HicB family antitoxin [Verrucomicrobiota bacterium]
MKYQVRVNQSGPDTFVAVWVAEPDCVARGRSREEALRKIRDEIQLRVEVCPCSGQVMGTVEVEPVN